MTFAILNEADQRPKQSGFAILSEDKPGTPQFETGDPAAMRAALVKAGKTELLPAFDAQFPELRPGQAGAGRGFINPPAGQPGAVIPGMPPQASVTTPDKPESWTDKLIGMAEAANQSAAGFIAAPLGSITGFVRSPWGKGVDPEPYMAKDIQTIQQKLAGDRPLSQAGQRYTENVGSIAQNLAALAPIREVQMLPEASKPAIQAMGDKIAARMAPEQATPKIEPGALPKPLYRQVNGQWQEVKPVEVAPPSGVSAPPVEGGVSPAIQAERAKVLQRLGVENVRKSALAGDKMGAATDFQVSRFTGEPAGQAAAAQFAAERDALSNHAAKTIESTGGTMGLDQDALTLRGRTIAKPFESLRTWFENAKTELYGQADQAAAGKPIVQPADIESLLNDRTFNNSAMAQDKGHLVNAIKSQLDLFKENNPDGLTVQTAEQFRQWLNQQWTKDNSHIIGQVKDAVDDAVLKHAGEDVYGKARALHQLEKQTLDNPKGVAGIMDVSPTGNRRVPYESIPDTVTRLDSDQFKTVLKTLNDMPAELRPEANAAMAEVQAHLANKMYDAGANNKGQWNAKKVTDFRKANSSNIATAFQDNPQSLSMLKDMESAGHILDYPSSYPGAAAQASQVVKRGIMSGLMQKATTATGAGVGGAVGGPAGAVAGAAVGEAAGARIAGSMSEKAALKRWQSGVTKLNDVAK